MYRAAYRAAFGKTAFKPYTHIGKHLSEHQTRLQYDVKDYSAEAQEHQGKIMKGFTKKQNGRLSKADKNGVKGASYIQQSSEAYQVKVAAEVAHPHLVKQNFRRKKTTPQGGGTEADREGREVGRRRVRSKHPRTRFED
jgi:hypothetical protein